MCRKCKKQIHDEKLAGRCGQCTGKEHYRCTRTGKENEAEYRKGTLSFKCTLCCAPGLWDAIPEEEEQEESEEVEETEITMASVLQENEGLKLKLVDYEENAKSIIKEAQGISCDNTELVKEVNILSNEVQKLRQELNKVRGNNKALAVENSNFKVSNKDTTVEINDLIAKN